MRERTCCDDEARKARKYNKRKTATNERWRHSPLPLNRVASACKFTSCFATVLVFVAFLTENVAEATPFHRRTTARCHSCCAFRWEVTCMWRHYCFSVVVFYGRFSVSCPGFCLPWWLIKFMCTTSYIPTKFDEIWLAIWWELRVCPI